MKRFRFSLEQLLRVKELREQLAEAAVARAGLEVQACRGRLDRLGEELAGAARQLEQFQQSAAPLAAWAAFFEQSSRLEQAVRVAEDELARAEAALQEARRARARLATEVEALNILRQQQLDLYRRECQAAEQQRLDEMGLRQWSKSVREGNDAQ